MNQLANLKFSWCLGPMEDHICIRWWNFKYTLKYLINWWRNLLKKSHKIPRWIRVSKANKLQTLDEFLIKIINEDLGDPYMLSRSNLNHLLIDLLALRVLNHIYELDGAWVITHYLQKQQTIHWHIFGIFVSKQRKMKYDTIKCAWWSLPM